MKRGFEKVQFEKKIRNLYDSGKWTQEGIAKKLGISRYQVRKALKSNEELEKVVVKRGRERSRDKLPQEAIEAYLVTGSVSRVAEVLGVSEATARRKLLLENLQNSGKTKKVSASKAIQIRRIFNSYLIGLPVADIAQVIGEASNSIYNVLKRLTHRSVKVPVDLVKAVDQKLLTGRETMYAYTLREKIVKYWNETVLTLGDLSAEFHLHKAAVERVLTHRGLPVSLDEVSLFTKNRIFEDLKRGTGVETVAQMHNLPVGFINMIHEDFKKKGCLE